MLKKGDMVVIVSSLILIITIFGWRQFGNSTSPKIAIVIVNGKIEKRIRLDNIKKTEYIKLHNKTVVLKLENGKICFYKSKCKNKFCIKTGWASKKGDKIVCVPEKTKITILDESDKIDGLSY
jgi:hypothetical protein